MSLLVGMIADDLTGALDAAAPFAERGLRTQVVLSAEVWGDSALHDAEVLCINTASREIAPELAAQRVTAATQRLLKYEPALFFKKVDSRLKGNLAIELSAMLAASGRTRAVLAPAIPDLGRFVRNGAVCGMGIAMPIEMGALLGDLPVSTPDTTDQGMLDAVADALAGQGGMVLAAGARGLALALARRFPARDKGRTSETLGQPTLIAIGSRDQITRAQVDHLAQHVPVLRLMAPNGAVPASAAAPITLVTAEPGDAHEDGATVATRFANGLATLVRRQRPAAIVISGGETAFALLNALDVARLELGGEALPGVPYCHALIGGEQVVILTKSGGFGSPETISLLLGFAPTLD